MTTAPAVAVANPAWLKLDLYCKGLRLDDSCFVEQDGGRKILRTRAGLGSGLELILPGGLWTNVPVTEGFARQSPYTLHRDGRPLPAAARRTRRGAGRRFRPARAGTRRRPAPASR